MGEENEKVSIKLERSWPKVLFHIHLHILAAYGLCLFITEATWSTVLLFLVLLFWGTVSLTIGCHRLWAHKTYQASLPLRLFLAAGQLLVCDGSIISWVSCHRLHHKHHGTDLDPHDHRRGVFFAQYASHCLSDNAEQERAKKQIPIDDLEEDSVAYFQNLLYVILMPLFGILLPINTAMEYCGESFAVAFFVIGFLRVVILLNFSWLIHSAYLIWGLDPMDKRSSDTWLVFFFNKSLWPQYHYLLPWDYRSGEYGTYDSGCSTAILKVFAALGLATGLTTISRKGVKEALAAAVESGRPVVDCLEDHKVVLLDIINQDPDNN